MGAYLIAIYVHFFKSYTLYLLVHCISHIWGWQDFTLMTEECAVTNKLVFCHVLYSFLGISRTGGTDTDMFDIHINCTLYICSKCCLLAFVVIDLSSNKCKSYWGTMFIKQLYPIYTFLPNSRLNESQTIDWTIWRGSIFMQLVGRSVATLGWDYGCPAI